MLVEYTRRQIIGGLREGAYTIQDLYIWLSYHYIDIIDFWYIQDAHRIYLLS